ncbi:carboxylesterase family protein, partial [Nonomuraea longicatena]
MRSPFHRTRLLALMTGGCLIFATGAAQAAEPPPAGGSPSASPKRSSIVQLDSGRIRGVDNGKVRTYKGIRFAQPPVGDLRWKHPKRVTSWKGVADATRPAQPCMQMEAGKAVGSEDCLFLNVTAPAKRSGKALPVMVWLYGGGYLTGLGSAYDAQRLADQGDVIVVTPNYRLGAFGYFGLPGLKGSGTFGLADQLEALRWTKRNA